MVCFDFCCCSQFVLLMTEAIWAFSSKSSANRTSYTDALNYHGGLQFCAGLLIALAFWSIYTHKNNNNYEHFSSRHSSLGLTTCLMVAGTMCGGISARFSASFTKSVKPVYLKIVHSIFGVVTYITAIFTFCLGLDSEWFRAQSSTQWINILTYSVAIAAFLALTKPIVSIASKIRSVTKSH